MRPKHIAHSWLFLFLSAAGIGCGDYPSLTDIDLPQDILRDTLPPAVHLAITGGLVDGGEGVQATVVDDMRVESAALILARANGTVLWESEPVSLETDSIDLVFQVDPPTAFPYGDTVYLTVTAIDAAGHLGAATTGSGSSLVFLRDGVVACVTSDGMVRNANACLTPIVVAHGRTHRLPNKGQIGGAAYDPLAQRLYLTDKDANAVRAFSLTERGFLDWHISVGSRPQQIVFERFAWGVQPTLVVMNSGGTDLSIVDLANDGRGGKERWRIPIPLIKVVMDQDTIPLKPSVSSVLVHCPDALCSSPKLFLGSPKVEDENRVFTRSLSLTALDPNHEFDILTPLYHPGVPPNDQEVTIQAFVVDPFTGQETQLVASRTASKCGTLAFGGSILATSENPIGPIYLVETGKSDGACGPSGRVLRFDRIDENYIVSAAAAIHIDYDDAVREIEEVSTNADGSLVLLRSGDNILITDGYLRRLGLVETPRARAIAFLEGQTEGAKATSGGALFAVAGSEGVDVFETAHFTKVAHFTTKNAMTGPLRFVYVGDRGELAIVGPNEDRDGIIVIYTDLSVLQP